MKILVLTNLYPPHHAGTYDFRCQMLTDSLRLRGHQVRVLTSTHGMQHEQRDAQVERRLCLNGVYEHPPIIRWSELKKLEVQNHQALRQTMEGFGPDVVHVGSLHGLSKSLIYTLRNSRLPTVYDVADDWLASGVREDPWLRFWNRPQANPWRTCLELAGQRGQSDRLAPTRMMKGYDRLPQVYGDAAARIEVEPNSINAFRFFRLFFCSQSLREKTAASGFQVNHGEVIYPGLPAEQFTGEIKPPAAPVEKFLVVAHLDEKSGVRTAIQALQLARESKLKIMLTICGRGESDYVAQVRSYVAQNQLPVEFLSVSNLQRDLPAIYRRHDAFLYTAEWNEPFCLTPLEAMACGLPVIASDIGAARELFRHGENAFVYPPGDAGVLAARIEELQTRPEQRRQMAEAGQQEALGRFNETAYVDQVESYLETSVQVWQNV